MYKVKVQNSCRCFLRSGLSEVSEFSTKEEAQKEAKSMIEHMESNFCKKHNFSMNEEFGDYTLYIKPRD